MFNLLIFIIITIIGFAIGGGVSFLIDLTKPLNMHHAHDMGLSNFFLLSGLGGLFAQIGLLMFYRNNLNLTILSVILIFLISAFLYQTIFN